MNTERLRDPAQCVANKLKELCGVAEAAGGWAIGPSGYAASSHVDW
jgi:hypothetical protein